MFDTLDANGGNINKLNDFFHFFLFLYEMSLGGDIGVIEIVRYLEKRAKLMNLKCKNIYDITVR